MSIRPPECTALPSTVNNHLDACRLLPSPSLPSAPNVACLHPPPVAPGGLPSPQPLFRDLIPMWCDHRGGAWWVDAPSVSASLGYTVFHSGSDLSPGRRLNVSSRERIIGSRPRHHNISQLSTHPVMPRPVPSSDVSATSLDLVHLGTRTKRIQAERHRRPRLAFGCSVGGNLPSRSPILETRNTCGRVWS